MKNTVIKYRILLSLEKELAFINKMNQQGYRLAGVFDSFYRFKKTEEEHFTIARAVAKREVASVTAQAAEQGLRRISVWGHTPDELLYFDGVKGEANEGFFESEECREAQRKGMQTHYCVNSCVLFGLFAFIVGWAFWGQMVSLPKIVSVWEAHGGIPGEYRWLLALYGMMVVLSVAGLAFLGCLSVGSLRLWHRAAKENGKGKQVLWIQVLLWLLIIPLLLGVYILEKPAEEVDDEPTLEDLREMAVLFEDYDYSTEKLGECYYFYGEYESDLLFEDVKPLLEEKGYRLEDFGNLLEEGDDSIYYMAVNDASESTIFVLECVTEEQAKKVYTLALEDSWEYMYHIHANYNYTVTRMGRMVYGTAYNDAAFPDLMGLYELPLPEPVPLYKGGTYTYWGNVGFEQAVTTAGRLKYTSYGYNEMLDEVFEDCRNFLTPDGRGYLSIVKLKSAEVDIEGEIPQDDKVLLWIYQATAELGFELFGNPFEQESMKYVMLSKDTFIAGTSYYVDAFMTELEKSITFEAYAPSKEKIGAQYYLYEEYEIDLLLEDVKPFFEERGYDIQDLSKRLNDPEDAFYYSAKNEETGVHVVMMECKTEERAKKVFEQIMARDRSHVFLAEPWETSVVVRVGRTIFGTLYGDQGVQDIFDACDLPLPTPVSLYKGGLYTYGGTVTFERALEAAKKGKYELGGSGANFFDATENLPFERIRYIVTPDHKGFLCIGQLARLWADKLPEKLYVSLDEQGKEAMKYVMLSGGTFIAGTSYYVDAFIAELEK